MALPAHFPAAKHPTILPPVRFTPVSVPQGASPAPSTSSIYSRPSTVLCIPQRYVSYHPPRIGNYPTFNNKFAYTPIRNSKLNSIPQMLLQKTDRTRPGFYRRIPVGAFAFVLSLEERMAGPFVKFMFVNFIEPSSYIKRQWRQTICCNLPSVCISCCNKYY